MEVLPESDERRLSEAQQRIHTLNTELAMHDDAQVQIAVLRKKLSTCKDRAQGLVNMIDRRITYLCKLWDEYMAKKDDNEIIELARTAVNEPVCIGLNKETDGDFFTRVNILKDKIAELILLDDQAAEAHKRATEDNKTLTIASKRLKEVEERHKALLATSMNFRSEGQNPARTMQKAVTALEKRSLSNNANSEERRDIEEVVRALGQLLAALPNQVVHSVNHSRSHTPGVHEDSRRGWATTLTSTGISGTTVPTNESSSLYTTSSFLSTPAANPQQNGTRSTEGMRRVKKIVETSKSASSTNQTSTTDI
ncbi:hypothetical protein RB195_006283 [Necator americanus]|uniref:Uncharacterized protein n=1 Tax=Necator americanus TaxID=51031 RepID=A0ABR1BRV7_NECAM